MSDRPPTPYQIAFLLYMKVPGAESMNRTEVEAAFQTLKTHPSRNLGHDYNLSGSWYQDRGLLFPHQYPEEREQFLDRSLRGYVRSKVIHNSAHLTKDKILAITRQFDAEDIYWQLDPGYKERFYQTLQQVHPDCCDGIPASSPKIAPNSPNQALQPTAQMALLSRMRSVIGALARAAARVFLSRG